MAIFIGKVNRTIHDLQSQNRSAAVTVIWVPPCFGYPRTQIPSVLGIPSRDTQNTESV